MKKFPSFAILLALGQLANAQAHFEDATLAAGLGHYGKNYSIAAADFDNDGLDDFFATRFDEPCALFRNNGDGTFSDVAQQAGLAFIGTPACAVWGDVNNDGHLDLFIGSRDEDNRLFISNGNPSSSGAGVTFSEKAAEWGVTAGGWVKSANFADVNKDGHLDLYLARLNQPNIFYKNTGNGSFVDNTLQSGTAHTGVSMAAIFFDYDNDGKQDLYLTHDANQPNVLLKNFGGGVFVDVSIQSGANIGTNGMGVDVADLNHDGWLDIYVTNLGYNSLLLSNGNPNNSVVTFNNVQGAAGANDPGMGWGCSFLDYDNDGWQDLYVANDSYFSPAPNIMYRNLGPNDSTGLAFEAVSAGTVLASMEPGYGLACADANDDGKLDIYLANYLGELGNQFFLNTSDIGNNWLKIKAIGTLSNRSAIGTRVTVKAGGMTQMDEITGGSGYSSQNSLTLHFGLGQAHMVDELIIRWPNGLTETYDSLGVNMTVTATEAEGLTLPEPPPSAEGEILPPLDFLTAYPNPVEDDMNFIFRLSTPTELRLRLYDALGHQVAEVGMRHFAAGQHILRIDSSNLPAGMYVAKLQGGHFERILKVVKH